MFPLLFHLKLNDIADAHGSFLAQRKIASFNLSPLSPVDPDSGRYYLEMLQVGTSKWVQVVLMHHALCKAPMFEPQI